MTRAISNLIIHLNSGFLDNLTADHVEKFENNDIHLQPNELAMHLSIKDVWLDYFISRQYFVSPLKSGDLLTIADGGCCDRRQFCIEILKTVYNAD